MRHCSRLPFDTQAPAAARQEVRALGLGTAWPEQQLEAALLATSEIVTDAVQTGRGPLELAVEVSSPSTGPATEGRSEVLRVEVSDTATPASRSGRSPAPVAADDGRGGGARGPDGHGFLVTPALTSRWGVREGPGTCTWFELDRLG